MLKIIKNNILLGIKITLKLIKNQKTGMIFKFNLFYTLNHNKDKLYKSYINFDKIKIN